MCKKRKLGLANNVCTFFTCDDCGKGLTPREPNPAHEVPFAYKPHELVEETFTITIKTPERSAYCGCWRCKIARAEFWRVYITNKVQAALDDGDPLMMFPEQHKVTVQ